MEKYWTMKPAHIFNQSKPDSNSLQRFSVGNGLPFIYLCQGFKDTSDKQYMQIFLSRNAKLALAVDNQSG